MIRRSIAILAWLVAGHLVLGGLYWALLQTPESNLLMLGISALLAVLMLLWLGVVEGVGLLGWRHAGTALGLVAATLRRVAWVLPALVVFGTIWWATGALLAYFAAHAGEIDAWFIANAGWVRTSWFHTSVEWILLFVRFAVGLSLALSLLAAGLRDNWRAVFGGGWIRRAFSWRTLAIVGIAMLAAWAGPWQLVYWRPAGLSATWIQPAFATAKLLLLFVVMNAAWAVVLWAIEREPSPAAAVAQPLEAVTEQTERSPEDVAPGL